MYTCYVTISQAVVYVRGKHCRVNVNVKLDFTLSQIQRDVKVLVIISSVHGIHDCESF